MSSMTYEQIERSHRRKRRRWQAALVLGSLALFGSLGTIAIYKKAETDTRRQAIEEVQSNGLPCELTSEANPVSGGAGFVLIARCPNGPAPVQPTLSLWTQLIDALPSKKRVVVLRCGARKNGDLTDCRKTNELATRDEEEQGKR